MFTRAAVVLGMSLLLTASVGTAAADGPLLSRAQGQLNSTSLGDCSGGGAGGEAGTVWVERLPFNRVRVKVRIDGGTPNETYIVNVSCIGAIGDVETDAEGNGTAVVVAAPPEGPGHVLLTSIVIDVHREAGGGAARTPGLALPLVRR